MPPFPNKAALTFEAAASVSNEISLPVPGKVDGLALFVPVAFTDANFKLQGAFITVKDTEDPPAPIWADMVDENGDTIIFSTTGLTAPKFVAASSSYAWIGGKVDMLRLVSQDGAGVAVNQASEITVYLIPSG